MYTQGIVSIYSPNKPEATSWEETLNQSGWQTSLFELAEEPSLSSTPVQALIIDLDDSQDLEVHLNLPVLFVASNSTQFAQAQQMGLENFDFILKPVVKPILLHRLERLLAARPSAPAFQSLKHKHTRNQAQTSGLGLPYGQEVLQNLLPHIAHDLRSPLCSLTATCERILKHEEQLSRPHRHLLVLALRSTYGLLRNIEEMLEPQRIGQHQLEASFQSTDLHQLIENCFDPFRLIAAEKSIELTNQVPPRSWVHTDPGLLSAAVQNLIQNSIKFCRPQDHIWVEMNHLQPNSILVCDSGPGIAEDIKPHLFSTAVVTTKTGSHGELGTGSGLLYCQEVLQTCGAELHLLSSDSKGTKFLISLEEQQNKAYMAPSLTGSAIPIYS